MIAALTIGKTMPRMIEGDSNDFTNITKNQDSSRGKSAMEYNVTFTLGGYITVEAESEEIAENQVEDLSERELACYCELEIQSVEEA